MKLLSVLLEKINDPYCTTFHCEGGLPHLPLTFHLCTKLGVPAPNILYVCVCVHIHTSTSVWVRCTRVNAHRYTSVCLCVSCRAHTRPEHMCGGNTRSPTRGPHKTTGHPHPQGHLTPRPRVCPKTHMPATRPRHHRLSPFPAPPGPPPPPPAPVSPNPAGPPPLVLSFPFLRALLHPPTAPWPRGSSSVTRAGDGRGRVALRAVGGCPAAAAMAAGWARQRGPGRRLSAGSRAGCRGRAGGVCWCPPGRPSLVPGARLGEREGAEAIGPAPAAVASLRGSFP